MINEKSIEAVSRSVFSSSFRKPLYDSYCFYQIPKTIPSLFVNQSQGLPKEALSDGPFDQVVLLFIDAFGWSFFDHYKSSLPFLKRAEKEAICSKLTSMFPSTTAAHVTCIHTGLAPNESGLYEWFLYEPKLNEIIAPLPFQYAGERAVETLPLDPKQLYPQRNLYHHLGEMGITSHTFQPKAIASSTCSKSLLAGSTIHGYQRPQEGLESLLGVLKKDTFAYFYYGDVDAVGHRKGIGSQAFQKEIEKIFTYIEAFFQKLPPKTALLITADHGMGQVFPKQTYYLNQKVPNIEKYLRFGARNKPLVPAGSCRDFFLHVNDESLHELQEILTHYLEGRAEVWLTETLMKEGLFGTHPPSDHFLKRVGNLAILPYEKEGIWWFEKGRFDQTFHGAHGGLSAEEMEIPLLFFSL